MNQLNILGIRNRTLLHRFKENTCIFMEDIDTDTKETLEKRYNLSGPISYVTKAGNRINPRDVILFGDIDLNRKEDINLLNKFENKIWDCLEYPHKRYSKVNFKNGVVSKDFDKNEFIVKEEYDFITWIKYHLTLLHNPKNVIIYKIDKRDLNLK